MYMSAFRLPHLKVVGSILLNVRCINEFVIKTKFEIRTINKSINVEIVF
jgi:hypothetical protein